MDYVFDDLFTDDSMHFWMVLRNSMVMIFYTCPSGYTPIMIVYND